ncbi:MAG TPA: filamentous hemagglutinin N-terminal domain-containing protein, partial [Cellvibrionaceae bacterium]
MNHVYRVVFNRVLGCWQAVAEIAKGSSRSSKGSQRKRSATHRKARLAPNRLIGAIVLGFAAQTASLHVRAQTAPAPDQLPQGGNVAAGQANINSSGNVMNIDQATQKAIINWQEFNVGADARVNFNQPGADSATLNRVLDANPSQIFGQIVAPGQVILINPNGAYFAPSASVDVGGLIATTHELADKDFLDGNYQFKRNGASGKIINDGELKAKLDGYIALMAPEVRNQGVIVAERGTVVLAAGEHIQLDFGTGNKLQGITVTEQDLDAQIENKHAIFAEGGLVILSARATAELRASVIKNSGEIVASAGANTVTEKGGRIILEGNTVQVTEGSELIATGPKGGGEVLIGGDWQGGTNEERRVFDDPDAVHEAKTVTVETNTKIDASATDNGDGGTVVVWSDITDPESVTTVQGEILAKGGENGGDGGQIETSGAKLEIIGSRVSASSAHGESGDWLLDPYDWIIGPENAGIIETALDGGSNVTITTEYATLPNPSTGSSTVDILQNQDTTSDTSTGQAGNITVSSTITATGSGNLTLLADGGIFIDEDISIGGAFTADAKKQVVLAASKSITTTGSNNNILLKAEGAGSSGNGYGYISLLNGADITSNGGDVILWSNEANRTSGTSNNEIYFAGNNTIESSGGKIVLAGGLDDGSNGGVAADGIPDGYAYRGGQSSASVRLNSGVELLSGGGDIIIRGQQNGSDYAVAFRSNLVINSGTGTITIDGQNSGNHAIDLADGRFAITSASTAQTAVTISGTTDSAHAGIVSSFNAGSDDALIQTTGASGGGIVIEGINDGSEVAGLWLGENDANSTLQILSNTGDISLVSNGIITLTNHNIYLGNRRDSTAIQGITPVAVSASGDVTLTTLGIYGAGFNATDGINRGKITVDTTGAFTFEPYATAFGGKFLAGNLSQNGGQLDFGGSYDSNTNTFTGSAADSGWLIIENAEQLGGLTIGKAGMTQSVALYDLQSIDGSISIIGGQITLNQDLVSTASGADILLKGSGNITLAASKAIQANNGDVIFWADSDANGGFITINAGASISTQGGDLVLAGGSDGGSNGGVASDGIPDGFAWRKTADSDFGGLSLGEGGIASPALISLLSDGGNIILRGKTSDASDHPGLLTQEALVIDAGSGTIDINGTSSTGHGVELGFGSTNLEIAIRSASNLATAISIQGSTTAAGKGGFFNLSAGSSLIQSEGTGAISISGTSTQHEGMVLDNLQILSASGKISLTGTGPNGGQLLRNTDIGLRSSATAIQGITPLAASSADIDLIANTLSFSNSANTIASTGVLRILPSGDAFSSALTLGTDFDPSANLTGLVIGKNHATAANVTLDKAITIAGPMTVYGGDITINQNLTSTAAGADILLKSSGYIAMASGSGNSAYRTLQTNNGNIVLWANAADGTSGGIQIGDWVTLNSANGATTQSTGGGKVWLAGGSSVNAQGLPTGAANGGTARSGISFGSYTSAATTTSIYSGGGDIYLNGESNGTYPGWGVAWNRTGIANAGDGTLTIKGEAKNANGYHGIELGAFSGSINITAGGGDANNPAILIDGTTSRSNFSGLQTISGSGARSIMQATGTGGITILTKGVTGNSYNSTVDLLAASGDILISAEGGTGLNFVGTIGQKTGTDVTSSSSNVTLRANAITVPTGTEVQTTGTLVVEPFGTSFTSALTWPLSNLTLGSGITGLTLGKEGNTANITINSAQTIAGLISVYGGNITVDNSLTSTAVDADILLKASAGIVNNGFAIISNAGDITLWSNSTSTTGAPTTGGVYLKDNSTLDSRTNTDRMATDISTATGGGTITLGGGSASTTLASGTVVPTGYAQNISGTSNGIGLGTDTRQGHNSNIKLYSGGGDISVRGQNTVAGGSNYKFGVQTYGGVTIDAGTDGNLTIDGLSTGNVNPNGVELGSWAAGSTAGLYKTSGTGSISITGTASVGSGDMIGFASASFNTIEATGTGTITLNGSSSVGNSSNPDLRLNGAILAASGDITVNANTTGGYLLNGATFGRKAGGNVLSSSSNVTLNADSFTFASGSSIATTGTVTIQPNATSTSFSSTLDLTSNLALSSDVSGLTVGK